MKTLEVEAHIGPIVYIADAFGLSTDNATKYIILLLIFVFEPLAVVLSICLNVVVFNRQSESTQALNETTINKSIPDEVDEPIHQRPAFDDIVVDLITNPVSTWTSSPDVTATNDQPPVELVVDVDPSEHSDQESKPSDDQEAIEPSIEEVPPDTTEKMAGTGTVFEIIDENEDNKHQPPSREIPRDSILDRWLKRRSQQ